jgi:hypothetical protein
MLYGSTTQEVVHIHILVVSGRNGAIETVSIGDHGNPTQLTSAEENRNGSETGGSHCRDCWECRESRERNRKGLNAEGHKNMFRGTRRFQFFPLQKLTYSSLSSFRVFKMISKQLTNQYKSKLKKEFKNSVNYDGVSLHFRYRIQPKEGDVLSELKDHLNDVGDEIFEDLSENLSCSGRGDSFSRFNVTIEIVENDEWEIVTDGTYSVFDE